MWKYALALLVVCAIGCQRSETTAGTTGTTAAPGAKLKVVFIPKNEGNPYFEDAKHGFEDAAKELGCEFVSVGPAKAEATSQIPVIKQQVQQRVDIIAISANSPDAVVAALDEAKAKGITVVTIDADITGNESHRDAGIMPVNFDTIGESQVELLGSQINYEGEIAILSATKDASNQNAWIKKMQEVLKQPKYAKMKLVEVAYGDDEQQKSMSETDGLLSKYPNLKGIIAPTTVGVAAAAQALEVAGVYPGGPKAKGAGVVLTGLGTPDQMRSFINKGVVKAVQLWSPRDMGYAACFVAVAMKKGEAKGPGDTVKAGKLGDLKIGEKGMVITGPLVTFDKASVANYHF